MPNIDTYISWWGSFNQIDVEVIPGFFHQLVGNDLVAKTVMALLGIALAQMFILSLRRGLHNLSPMSFPGVPFADPGYLSDYQRRWNRRVGGWEVDLNARVDGSSYDAIAGDLVGYDTSYRDRVDSEMDEVSREARAEMGLPRLGYRDFYMGD